MHDELWAKYKAQPRIPWHEYDDFLISEIAKLRAELAAAKAEPPRPAAIVVHRHCTTGGGFHLHLFEGDRDAVKYSCDLIAGRVLPHDVRKIDEVTWHPKSP